MNITEGVNSLTPDQYIKLLDIAAPITDAERNMTIDEIAKELQANN